MAVFIGNTLMIMLSAAFASLLLLTLIKFFHRVWWRPIQIQCAMRRQGIQGPAYKFLHGSKEEITNMRKQSAMNPMELSHHILPRIEPHIYSWSKLYGANFLYWYGSQAQLVVTEPRLVRELLNAGEGTFQKTHIQDYVYKLLGKGIVTSVGENWYAQRKIAVRAFHAERLKGVIPEMIICTESMLEKWKDREGKEIEVHKEFKILTSELIARTAFGSTHLEGQKIFSMLMKMAQIISRNQYKHKIPGIGLFLKTNDGRELDKLEQGMKDAFLDIITKRNEKVLSGEADNYGNDYLGILLETYHDKDRNARISVDAMIDDCKTVYIAGHETTAGLLAWTSLLLAIHTDWQEKARKEIADLFRKPNPDPDVIARLKIMSMIVNEALRLYSPVLSFFRKAKREARIGKLNIPANVNVEIPPLALHHDPNTWGEDVHLFKPERFAEGVAKATKHGASAFLPFSHGPRACVAMNLATLQAKIVLAMILRRYKFNLSPNYVHSPIHRLIVYPQHGVHIILKKL